MHEEEENNFFNSEFQSELAKFEASLENGELGFYDSDILEQFVDHFLIKNQIKKALQTCEHALYQFPYNSLFRLRKAQILSAIGQLEESLTLLDTLDDYNDSTGEYYATKASIYSQLKQPNKAIQFFLLAIENCDAEELDELYLDLAIEYETVQNFEKAIEALTKILDINPNNEAALYEIAFCYDLTKDYQKSVEFYNKYIENHPYSYTAWYNLGNSYCRMENFEKAVWAYDYCTIINDKFASAFFNMGNALGNLNKFGEAILAYNHCIELDGDDALTYNYLGEAYEKLEQYDLAISKYQKALDINDQLAEPWLGIGIVKDLQGYSKESVNFIKKAVELRPENGDYWHVLAEAYEKTEQWEDAESAFVEAIEKCQETNNEAIISLASIKAMNSHEESIDFLLTTIDEKKVSNEVQTFLVAEFWRNKQFTESTNLFEYLVSSNKDSIKNLFLHLPEAKELQAFIQIIENYS